MPAAVRYRPVSSGEPPEGKDEAGRTAEMESDPVVAPVALLSGTQLVLRRGLALLLLLVLLFIGMAAYFAFPAPEPTALPSGNLTAAWDVNATMTPTPWLISSAAPEAAV